MIEKFNTQPGMGEDTPSPHPTENNANTSEATKDNEKKMREKERYNPSEREKYWQDFWDKEKVYEFDPEQSGPLFTIDAPPPTISGDLHMGHIFSYVQAEVVARFQRMKGSNVRYPIGYDNNGLPTERLVEKEIGKRGQDLALQEFVQLCLETTGRYRAKYEDLLKSAGFSMDWRLEYSTISPEVQKFSQTVFKELYDKGVIYKENAPALYCPECHTAFAQAEKDDSEKEAVFYDLKFKTEEGEDLFISTTRPELLPACVAVFVNPKDQRYSKLTGKKVTTPLGQEVTIYADDKVDVEKGSGAVMCCTYGDETDIYWAKTHGLSEKIILDRDGRLKNVAEVPEMNGKSVKSARDIIVEKLREGGFINREEKIKHNISVHERCGRPVEFLPTTQWFMKMLDMKQGLLDAGKKIDWYPPHMRKRYEEWVSNLKWDWCISRERFYGIPIPVYNCDSCENIVIPDESEFPMDPKIHDNHGDCPHCKSGKLTAERSVLDTWFTSSLTPDINNNHSLNGPLKEKLYPATMRPLGHDIIRTWVVYSVLMGLYRHQEAPWKDLMVSGHILLRKGEKISKKTGGGKLSPQELIASKSADAIRYAMCGAILGKDAYFDEQEVEKGRKLETKIYNAGKLVLGKIKDFDPNIEIQEDNLEAFDRWILQRSQETSERMSQAFANYEFSQARKLFEDFFWSDFCDNYLELAKGRLSIDANDEKRRTERLSAQYASYKAFLNVLKIASPFVPHITEEMYHGDVAIESDGDNMKFSFESGGDKGYFHQHEGIASIHNTKWPSGDKSPEEGLERGAQLALLIISEARKSKTMQKIRFGAEVSQLTIRCTPEQKTILLPFMDDISAAMKAQKTTIAESNATEVSVEA